MTRPIGNVRLKAARQHAGYGSQQALADALTRAAPQLGLRHIEISTRQVRRWESATPPWPRADHQRLLVHVLQLPVEDLGFTPPWDVSVAGPDAAAAARHPLPARHGGHTAAPLSKAPGVIQPSNVASDYAAITAAYRRLYTDVEPTHLHPPVIEHTRMGTQLLGETAGVSHTILATALAETLLLAGRIEFFDLRQPDDADATFVRALQAAGEADDALLGSAILAHAAFIPGWVEPPRRGSRPDARRPHLRTPGPGLSRVPGLARCRRSRMRDDQRPHPRGAAADRPRRRHPGRRQPVRLTGLVHLVLTRHGWPRSRATPSSKPGTCPQAKETLLAVLNDPSIAGNRDAASSSVTWPPSKPPSTTPKPPAPTPSQALDQLGRQPGTPPAWTACSKSARPSSRTPNWTACRPSMTGSTTGRPPSARSSVKRRDPAGQLGQRINPQRRHPAGGRVILPDHRPRAALDQRRPQPQPGRGHDVVIQPVTHIQGLGRADTGIPRSSSRRTPGPAW